MVSTLYAIIIAVIFYYIMGKISDHFDDESSGYSRRPEYGEDD